MQIFNQNSQIIKENKKSGNPQKQKVFLIAVLQFKVLL